MHACSTHVVCICLLSLHTFQIHATCLQPHTKGIQQARIVCASMRTQCLVPRTFFMWTGKRGSVIMGFRSETSPAVSCCSTSAGFCALCFSGGHGRSRYTRGDDGKMTAGIVCNRVQKVPTSARWAFFTHEFLLTCPKDIPCPEFQKQQPPLVDTTSRAAAAPSKGPS